MLSPVFDGVLILVSYLLLFFVQQEVLSTQKHSLSYRMIGFLAGWALLFSLLDWSLNVVVLGIKVFTEGWVRLYAFGGVLLMTGMGLRAYYNPPPGLDFDTVREFLHDSLFFNNYLRRTDSDLREEHELDYLRDIHRETSDTPLEEILPQEHPQENKRLKHVSSESIQREKEQTLTDKIRRTTDRLRKGETVNMSDEFRIQLMDNLRHPYLPNMEEFIVDPVRKTLTMKLPLPDTLQVDASNERQIDTIIGDVYVMLQILKSETWFLPYTPFFRTMVLRVHYTVWGDLGTTTVRELLTISLSLRDLRQHEGEIMPADSVKRIATIEYH